MKRIDTLIEDVTEVLNGHHGDHEVPLLPLRIRGERKPREFGKLWASDLGSKCLRKKWYEFNLPEAAERGEQSPLRFYFGDLIEDLFLSAAKLAGHTVEYEQHRVEYQANDAWTVSGRIDAVIDGELNDVKSCSPYAFKKYTTEGLTNETDTFGYKFQIGFYAHNVDVLGPPSPRHPTLSLVQKSNGELSLLEVETPSEAELEANIRETIDAIEADDPGPFGRLSPSSFGRGGNLELPIGCQFCDFRNLCWKEANAGAGIRSFQYRHKVVHLVHVEREPRVEEIVKDEG